MTNDTLLVMVHNSWMHWSRCFRKNVRLSIVRLFSTYRNRKPPNIRQPTARTAIPAFEKLKPHNFRKHFGTRAGRRWRDVVSRFIGARSYEAVTLLKENSLRERAQNTESNFTPVVSCGGNPRARAAEVSHLVGNARPFSRRNQRFCAGTRKLKSKKNFALIDRLFRCFGTWKIDIVGKESLQLL